MPIYIGNQAVEEFIRFCKAKQFTKFLLIADKNTYGVLGERVHQAVKAEGWDVLHIILDPEGLHADSVTLSRVFAVYDGQPRLFIGVGSGTMTDTARFTSHRSQNSFVSFPTAASVDAYTSVNAPVTIGELKGSIYCQAPIGIFTDIETIVNSPKWLTASGFGDLVSKFTSSTDWIFTNIIWGSDFVPEIYERARGAAESVAEVVEGITIHDPESMTTMMNGQFDSGFCMADFGNSAPASGGEHHIAHIWEMMFHWAGKEGLYHGNAVGVATIMEAEWFDRLKKTSHDQARDLLEKVEIPSREVQEERLRQTLPEIAEELIESDPIYMQLTDPEVFSKVKSNILEKWDQIQEIAEFVPQADQFREWFKRIGAPTTIQEIGVTEDQSRIARDYGHYLRERFSMNNIRHLFGWE
jgi:glycerol-1-phosphate dehydrogenase [NAD(P)+]